VETDTTYTVLLEDVKKAQETLDGISQQTPLIKNPRYSKHYSANILFKREDLQLVRSYKIRGAYNKIYSLSDVEKAQGVVCASAGNHAQGFAYSCHALGIHGTIYMPAPTPKQKVEQVKMFGEEFVDVILEGDTFDDSKALALEYSKNNQCSFIHPFDDPKIIEGQATMGLELLEQSKEHIDYIFLPVGGGGLGAGISSVFKLLSPDTKIIGVEPAGAPAMTTSFKNGYNTELDHINKFVDGAAVKKSGDLTFQICKELFHDMVTVHEGHTCQTILDLYNKDAIVVEPAGALSLCVLDQFKDEIKGKNVVCIISGSNNDITRMEEIKERALLYGGLKHYFLVRFPQRAGALREFVEEVLGPQDDITHFEYTKKTSREKGAAVVGIELRNKSDFDVLIQKMKERQFLGVYLNDNERLLSILI
jgi:threonine dehydratase